MTGSAAAQDLSPFSKMHALNLCTTTVKTEPTTFVTLGEIDCL